MMALSTDPLTAATTAILLPALRAAGFRRKTGRVIARVHADILQFFDLQLEAYGGKVFCVNYASLPLFCPRDYWILQPGTRLNQANGCEAWVSAKTHDAADLSMGLVRQMAESQAMPFFESTKTPEGLLAYLEHENWGSQHHLNFEKACCEARLSRLPDARRHALRAIELYREDGRSWCTSGIELCERLLAAIDGAMVGDLLRQWTDHSIAKLRLEKLIQ